MNHTLKRRILGLDFGNKTCGVAVSDQLGMSAHGVEIIRREKKTKLRATYRRIGELIEEYDPEKIVLGLPLNMDNSEGWRVEDTYAFRDELVSKFGLPVILTDERLTTVEAYEIMEETGVKREDMHLYVDEIAAMLILQRYMDGSAETRE